MKGQDGITLSGGDPLFQIEASLEIAKHCKQNNLNVWCYTGYTFEQLLEMSKEDGYLSKLLQYIDVLVDGKFEQSLKSFDLFFRGSSNQRILDAQKSMKQQKAIKIPEFDEQQQKDQEFKFGKTEMIFI